MPVMEGIEKGMMFFMGFLLAIDGDKSVLMKCWWNALRALPAASQMFDILWFQQKSS